MDRPIDLSLKKAFIKKQACFSQFTEIETEALASILTEVHKTKGDVIVKQGDPVDSIYIIVSGTADVRVEPLHDTTHHSESVATLNPGDAIGLNESGFYSISGLRTATVIALSDIVLLHLKLTEFHGFSLAYHHVNELMRMSAAEILGLKP